MRLRAIILAARLSRPLVPSAQRIWTEGDPVIVVRDGQATTRDGRPYRNTYTWFFTTRDGKAVEVRALLDLAVYDRVLATVTPAPGSAGAG